MHFLQSRTQPVLLVGIILAIPFPQAFPYGPLIPEYSINHNNSIIIHSRAPLDYVKVKGYSRRYKSPNPLLDNIIHSSQANIKPNNRASGASVSLQIPFP